LNNKKNKRNIRFAKIKLILKLLFFIDVAIKKVTNMYEISDMLMYALLKNMPAVKKNSRHIPDKQ